MKFKTLESAKEKRTDLAIVLVGIASFANDEVACNSAIKARCGCINSCRIHIISNGGGSGSEGGSSSAERAV